jgi:hypothetical protein
LYPLLIVWITTKCKGGGEDGVRAYQLARELLFMKRGVTLMLRVIAACVVFTVGIGAAPPAQGQKKTAPRQQQKSEKTSSMTGCIDQQEARYVLVDDSGLTRIAELEADGFPIEGFAKHVGHKVIVRGTSVAGEKPVFRVRAVETVSDTCAPANHQKGRQ